MALRNRVSVLIVICAMIIFPVSYLLIQNGIAFKFHVNIWSSTKSKTTGHEYKVIRRTTGSDHFEVKIRPDIYLVRNYSGVDPNCLNTIQKFVTEDGDTAIVIPRQSELLKLREEEVSCLYHRYIYTLQQHCSLLTRIGNMEQGGWKLCMDDRYKPNKKSLVYSFSYSTDYSKYTNTIAEKYQSEVHSYAPNILEQTLTNRVFNHQAVPINQRHLQTIIEKNNHLKRNLDILTLDMENNSIQFLKEAVNKTSFKGVKQISFLLKRTTDDSSKQDYVTILETLRDLFDAGFCIVWMERITNCIYANHPKRSGCNVLTMVRKTTDISIEKQSHYLIPPSLSSLPRNELGVLYNRYSTTLQYFCKQIVRMGRIPDGGWDICHDAKFRPTENCLVYSFGIDNDFSFDDDIANQYGCEVHSFDPSLNLEEHKHSDKVYFHPVGLSDSKREMKGHRGGYWKLNNLFNIRKELGHKRQIDVLKLDIEFSEWAVIPSMVKSGVLSDVIQLSVELHTQKHSDTDTVYIQRLTILKSLYDCGFRIFWSYTNVNCKYYAPDSGNEWSGCYEIDMVNINIVSSS